MKKIVLAALFLFIATTFVFAKTKDLQFRAVFSEEDSKKNPSQKYSFVPNPSLPVENIFVGNEVLLSLKDVQTIEIIRKEKSYLKKYPMINILFNAQGAVKLKEATAKHLKRRLAVVVGSEVFVAPYIVYPLSMGYIQLSSWKVDTDEKAADFVKELGFEPVFKGDKK